MKHLRSCLSLAIFRCRMLIQNYIIQQIDIYVSWIRLQVRLRRIYAVGLVETINGTHAKDWWHHFYLNALFGSMKIRLLWSHAEKPNSYTCSSHAGFFVNGYYSQKICRCKVYFTVFGCLNLQYYEQQDAASERRQQTCNSACQALPDSHTTSLHFNFMLYVCMIYSCWFWPK